jgi:hypothetical protein
LYQSFAFEKKTQALDKGSVENETEEPTGRASSDDIEESQDVSVAPPMLDEAAPVESKFERSGESSKSSN